MATVSTTIAPTIRVNQFTGYVDARSPEGALARAEVLALTLGGSVAATGAGDNQFLTVNVNFPVNFAYVITDIAVGLSAAAGNDCNFANSLDAKFFDDLTAPIIRIPMEVVAAGEAQAGSSNQGSKTYVGKDLWSGLLKQSAATTPRLQLQGYNETANDGAYSVDVAVRALQYDIVQMHHLTVNSNIPTR